MHLRRAVSVVEVLVALIILSVAALGSAAAIGIASRAHGHAGARREALDALRWKAALLEAAPCDSLASGSGVVRGVPLAWTVARDSLAHATLSANHRGTQTVLRLEVACE